MRKQMKVAALVSAAALLAIGASMTSFAATGWQEEDGTWVYYDRQGDRVSDEWEKSGNNWYYLDDEGYMATDALIEDDDNYYYVDANGVMVTNQWVAIDNEDAGDDDQPDVWWYYFQNNGKAYKRGDKSTIFKKSINGKTYCFDEDGKMQYGWVAYDEGTTNYDDNAWQDCEYFFGDENDGAMTTGWREIAIVDDEAEDNQPGDGFWDEDQIRWFNFKSSGKKRAASGDENSLTVKTLKGVKYGFDGYGRMVAEWFSASASEASASDPDADYVRTFSYFSSPENGARITKGWFKVVPGYYLNRDDYEDDSDDWYYADGKGKLVASVIKTIKGKKYAFNELGQMLDGLVALEVDGNDIVSVLEDDFDDYSDDDFDEFITDDYEKFYDGTYGIYFFSNDPDHDGTLKTGTQTIELDGDNYSFKFQKNGSRKGQGLTKVDDHKIYLGGRLLKAGSDDKIKIVNLETFATMTVADFVKDKEATAKNMTKDEAKAQVKAGYKGCSEGDDLYIIDDDGTYAVINTSGNEVKSGSKKDGDGFKVYVSNYKITHILIED